MAAPTVANTPSASYLEESIAASNISTFGGSTHTSSAGSDRCLVGLITARSNVSTSRTLSSLLWSGLAMTKTVEARISDSAGIGITATICTLKNPTSATAGAIVATYSANVTDTQIWFFNVEDNPLGAADAFATDIDDASGGTAVDISIAPTVNDTLCIMLVAQLASAITTTFSPLTERDEKLTAASALRGAIASGTLASSGAQSVQATLSGTNEFASVAIALSGGAAGGFVGRGLVNSILLAPRSLVG